MRKENREKLDFNNERNNERNNESFNNERNTNKFSLLTNVHI